MVIAMSDAAEDADGLYQTDGGVDIVSNGGRNSDGSPRILSRWTFDYAAARDIVREEMQGRVLNACAGKTQLDHDAEIVRNDLNPERDADMHVDVCEIGEHVEPQSFDTVLFDPPFDEKQAETKYDGMHAMDVYAALEQFNEIVRPGGKVVCFGWNSWGMRSFPAFERSRTTLLQRGPIHRDVIVTVDVRTSGQIGVTPGDE